MVDITTVYDLQHSRTLYVYVNEEDLIVATFDYIRQELPEDLSADQFMLFSIKTDNISWEPSFDNREMNDLPDDAVELVWIGWQSYLINATKDEKHSQHIKLDQVPPAISIDDHFRDWLLQQDEDSQEVLTDGHVIMYPPEYRDWLAETEYDSNGREASVMLKHLEHWLATRDESDEQREEFENATVQIIFDGTLYTFQNCAAVFNGLEQFGEYIIDEQ